MEKDWEARFRLSDSRNYGYSVWLLFPLVTLWFFGTGVVIVDLISVGWGRTVFFIGIGCFAALAAYYYQGVGRSLKLFCLGVGITLTCQVFLRILPPRGLWSLLLLPIFAASPPSYILALASIDTVPGTLREQVVTEAIVALINGISYAVFGTLVSCSRSPSSKFPPWPFRRRA